MSTSIVHGYVFHPAPPAKGWGQGLLETLRVWQGRATLRRHLAGLDDRLLRDIGMDRRQALTEASKPFWRA